MEMTPEGGPGSSSTAKRARAKPKATVKPAGDEAPATKKPRTPRKPSPSAAPETSAITPAPNDEELGGMIATAAYYLAAARNFMPGHELDDWLEAERTVRSKLYG